MTQAGPPVEAEQANHEESESTVAAAPSRVASRVWLSLAALVPLLAFVDGFSTSRVFYIRDLSFFYWPVHRWARGELLAGRLPLWDPYPGFGQPAIAEAARHLLFPPALVFRLLLPDALGFNLYVASAFVVTAVGSFLFLRHRRSEPAALLGALVFTLSGPVLSLGQMVNHAWTLAFTPFALLGAELVASDRRRAGFLLMATATALQALAGEPVTLAVTSGLALVYAALIRAQTGWRYGLQSGAVVLLGSIAGFLLAGAQTIPLLAALSRSAREMLGGGNALPVHPLSLVETVAWPVFDNPFNSWNFAAPWLHALNDGVDPYLFSVYVGFGAIAFAVAGAIVDRRNARTLFWVAVLLTMTILAMGDHTPIYPAVRSVVPLVALFRYPAKYLCFASFALAALAAVGWDAYRGATSARAKYIVITLSAVAASAAAIVWLAPAVAPAATTNWLRRLAELIHVPDSEAAAASLSATVADAGLRLFLVALGVGAVALLGAIRYRETALPAVALFFFVVADPFTLNSSLNPTVDRALVDPPAWTLATRADPQARVYVPGRIEFYFREGREEGLGVVGPELRRLTSQQASAAINARFPSFPAAAPIREAISMDLTNVWPREYVLMLLRYANSPGAERLRFLERTGVRYFVLRDGLPESVLLQEIDDFQLALFDRPGAKPRAWVAAAATSVADPRDAIDALFSSDVHPDHIVVLWSDTYESPERPSVDAPGTASIESDTAGEVRVRALAGASGGYLILTDSWDPYWTATVNGQSAQVLRAYGLFRAVRLAPGEHEVVFTYRPMPFYLGCAVSAVTAALLLGLGLVSRRRAKETSILPRHGEETVR